ncbi:MAG: hypothetical protein KC455_03340 [Carnobacterium sp.]|nr:hypothetical protein [Carnobacterium sp.]
MQLLARIKSEKDTYIPSLFKTKEVSNFHLAESKYIAGGRAFEFWWYEYKGTFNILAKHLFRPHYLYFILIEENEVFTCSCFDYYLRNGTFKPGGADFFGE